MKSVENSNKLPVLQNGLAKQNGLIRQQRMPPAAPELENGYHKVVGDKVDAKDYVIEVLKDRQKLEELASYAVNYAHSIGFVGLLSEHRESLDLTLTPPMSLLPSPFPRELYRLATSVQETLNELYFRISLDQDFLVEAYRDVVRADEWVARQVDMLERVKAEGVRQKVVLHIQRVDYMAHLGCRPGDKLELKQIEVNLGPGGPGFAPKVAKLHRRMLAKVESLNGGALPALANGSLPERRPIAEALFQAWKLFNDPQALAVLVFDSSLYPIQHHEHVQLMQFGLERLGRQEGFRLNVVRMTLAECAERMRLDEEGDHSLLVDGQKRVALVYLVYGYLPEHYLTEKEWKCQLDMERSTACVSPNIRSQLSGTKKVQQLLAKPGMLERFLPERPEKVAELRSTFTGLWGLEADDEKTRALIADAIRHPENYVLKALRDDGVGNYFDEELAQLLCQMSPRERSAYILQQKIRPIAVKNYLKRPFHAPQLEDVVSELGIFGTFVGTTDGISLWNRVDGHVVKTKTHGTNQGGIGEGSGVIDSALLFPESQFY